MADQQEGNANGGAEWTRWLRVFMWVVMGLVLLLIAANLLPQLGRRGEVEHFGPTCQNNLKQIGIVMRMYAGGARGERFPMLTGEAGNLSSAPPLIVSEYVSDSIVFVCPERVGPRPGAVARWWHGMQFGKMASSQMNLRQLLEAHRYGDVAISEADLMARISDTSYFYLGYAISSDEQLAAFAEVYKERIAAKLAFDEDLPAPPGKGTGNGDTFYLLREGIERFIITDINNPAAAAKAQSEVPVLIERTGAHSARGGAQCGNVLFMDGHVAFQVVEDRPEAFPMTPRAVKILQELDSLGPPPAF